MAEIEQLSLIDTDPDWKKEWQGMPEFSMEDVTPQYRIMVSFVTRGDVEEFAEKLGVRLQASTNSCWYPQRDRRDLLAYQYQGEKIKNKYPICLPSKGRFDCQTTGVLLEKMGMDHRFFVEETEYGEYVKRLGNQRVVKMPFHDLGQGSIPARNFIWEWAKENGHKRHWVVDDNILEFCRCNHNSKLRVNGGGFFSSMEEFADRYENIALLGPHDRGFVDDRTETTPFLLNSRVYSCILIDTNLAHRWRGRYNEDTDLSLRCLKDGLCTVLFRALLMRKGGTVGAKTPAMKGGNTDNVYNMEDQRRAFAESLKEQHPDVVEVVWKFNRWHHQVNYAPFKKNKLIRKPGIVIPEGVNNYGMVLINT